MILSGDFAQLVLNGAPQACLVGWELKGAVRAALLRAAGTSPAGRFVGGVMEYGLAAIGTGNFPAVLPGDGRGGDLLFQALFRGFGTAGISGEGLEGAGVVSAVEVEYNPSKEPLLSWSVEILTGQVDRKRINTVRPNFVEPRQVKVLLNGEERESLQSVAIKLSAGIKPIYRAGGVDFVLGGYDCAVMLQLDSPVSWPEWQPELWTVRCSAGDDYLEIKYVTPIEETRGVEKELWVRKLALAHTRKNTGDRGYVELRANGAARRWG